MEFLFLLLGLWRCWLGGGIGKDWPVKSGLRYVQLIALLLLVYAATWHASWQVTLIDAIAIALIARGYGHGPMLQIPLKPDPDGDFIYDLVAGIESQVLRWWAYAGVRYIAPAMVWGLALAIAGGKFLAPVSFGCVIVLAYRTTWALRGHLPTMTTPGDETQNWAELMGWTAAGFMLAAA